MMTSFTETEYNAIQDLIELDLMTFGDQEVKIEDKKSLIKDYIQKVETKMKNRLPKIEFPSACDWFNTEKPWSGDHLLGRIALLDFWTYCCINCMQIIPDLEALEETFETDKNNVVVIGVHSAKFDNERIGQNISNSIQRYGICHPVINDVQAILWQNLSISCWPTVLLCDPFGKPLKFFVGEGHRQDMIDFVQIAMEFFKEEIQNDKLEAKLPPLEFGLQPIESVLKYPGKVLVQNDLIFISDSGNHRIIIGDLHGNMKYVIGDGMKGHADGPFGVARFNSPQGLAYSSEKNCVFVCDTTNHVIRCIDLMKFQVSTIAGNGNQRQNSYQGMPSTSELKSLDLALASPWDICSTSNQNILYITMAGSHQIWDLNIETGLMNLKSGTGKEENRNNSYPLKASFAQPSGISYNGKNVDFYIADSESSSIRVFNEKNGVKNICGGSKNPMDLFSFGDLDGKGTEAKLQHPLGVAYVPDDTANNQVKDEELFIVDSYNHKLKKITDLKSKTPRCTTCPVEGLNEPGGLCFDGIGSLYIADTNNHKIKIVNIETFEMKEFDLEMPKNAVAEEEVDFSRSNNLVIQALKTKDIKIKITLQPDFSLNQEAPNGWKMLFPPETSLPMMKGQIDSELKINLPSQQNNVDKFYLDIKMYLCSNGLCTVQNKKISFDLIDNLPDDNEGNVFNISI